MNHTTKRFCRIARVHVPFFIKSVILNLLSMVDELTSILTVGKKNASTPGQLERVTKPIYIISDFSLCHSNGVCYWHGCSHWQCLHNAGNLNGTLHSRLQTPQNQDPLYLRKSKKTDHFSGHLLFTVQLTKVISSSIVALDVTVKNIQRNTCSTVTLSNEFHGYATLEMVE